LAAQDAALRTAGCAKVFAEKASGAKTDSAELRRGIGLVGESDELMVTRLDRLARLSLLNSESRTRPGRRLLGGSLPLAWYRR